MIVAIEGPDCSGKTTLFNALVGKVAACFVPGLPLDPRLLPVMDAVEERQIALWGALYDPAQLYICDRSVFVSGVVYAKLYNRPVPDVSAWISRVRVLYMCTLPQVLMERYKERGDSLFDAANFDRIRKLYNDTISQFEQVSSDGNVNEAIDAIYEWWE